MSYSKAELQAIFYDVGSLMAEVNPSFRADASKLISEKYLANEIDNLEGSVEFEQFKGTYGEESGSLLLKIKDRCLRNEKKIKEQGIDTYLAEELSISSDQLLPIFGHWLKTQPEQFRLLLNRYPLILKLIRENHDFETTLANAAQPGIYQPSYRLFAEKFAFEQDLSELSADKHAGLDDFYQSANSQVLLAFMALQYAENNGHLNVCRAIELDQAVVKQEQEQRQRQRDQGSEKALEFLIQIRQAEIMNEIADNKTAVELAFLEGKEVVLLDDGKEYSVASIIGFNTVNMTALQRLEKADEIENLIEAMNKGALIAAILDDREFVEVIVDYKKQQQKVSSIIGFDAANMGEAGKKEAIQQLEALKAETHRMNAAQNEQGEESAKRILAFLLSIKRKEVAESTVNYKSGSKEIIRGNEDALIVAILAGKESFEMVVKGKWFSRKVQVADVIGSNPTEMTTLQRLGAVNNVEALKANHCNTLRLAAMDDMKARKSALGDKMDPTSVKIDEVLSKGIAILEGATEYTYRNPHVAEKSSTINIDMEQFSPAKRLETFKQHCKENKTVFLSEPIQKVLSFAKTIKNLVHKKLDKIITRETVVQEPSVTANSERETHKDRHETKLSDALTLALRFFHENSPTVTPLPSAGNTPGIKPPTVA